MLDQVDGSTAWLRVRLKVIRHEKEEKWKNNQLGE